MRILDVTQPIARATPVWPGDPAVAVEPIGGPGDPAVSRITLGSHTGTHVDAPAHFFAGARTVDRLSVARLIGPAWVAQITAGEPIGAAALDAAGIPDGTTRLLLRTRNSERRTARPAFDPDFAALAAGAAGWLLARGIVLVGIDGPSIEPFAAPGEPVHRALLAAEVIIVEGLVLQDVAPGAYEIICLPLALAGGDGAPARVVLIANRRGAVGGD